MTSFLSDYSKDSAMLGDRGSVNFYFLLGSSKLIRICQKISLACFVSVNLVYLSKAKEVPIHLTDYFVTFSIAYLVSIKLIFLLNLKVCVSRYQPRLVIGQVGSNFYFISYLDS